MDANKILVSEKESYGGNKSIKYFIEYSDNDVVRPLCIMLPQMIGYVKCLHSNKASSFKVSDTRLLKKCIKMLERLSSLVDKEFDSEPVYGDSDKYIKTKIKLYGDKINTNFQDKTVSKENTPMLVINYARFCY